MLSPVWFAVMVLLITCSILVYIYRSSQRAVRQIEAEAKAALTELLHEAEEMQQTLEGMVDENEVSIADPPESKSLPSSIQRFPIYQTYRDYRIKSTVMNETNVCGATVRRIALSRQL